MSARAIGNERDVRRQVARDPHGGALAGLAIGAFTVGTSELVVLGILDRIADDVQVSISTAGTLVTAYALGIARADGRPREAGLGSVAIRLSCLCSWLGDYTSEHTPLDPAR